MQFEEFNKKMRDAAEQHHPAYDEQAWDKMEKLLDQHMPQDKDERRRFIFWFFPLLLVGGGLFIIINQPWKSKTQASNIQQITIPQSKNNSANNSASQITPQSTSQSTTNTANTQRQQSIQQQETSSNSVAYQSNSPISTKKNNTEANIAGQNLVRANHKNPGESLNKLESSNKLLSNNQNVGNEKNNSTTTNNSVTPNDPLSNLLQQNNAVAKDQTKTDQPKTEITQSDVVKADVAKTTEEENKQQPATPAKADKKKQGSDFLRGFGISVAAGPDVSKAGGSSLGKTTIAYGAAISYSWKRFTLRTGVFSAQKIYSANEGDYKLSYSLPPSLKFEGADANCRVTEIPVLLSYNFADKKKSNWYVSSGLSSYLMNREDYTYWYSTSSGNYYPKEFQFVNKNKHYFSVIDLSAGYTRKLNDRFSISAEPYLKIPFTGIGQGQVQLNSAGIMFSVGVKPFATKQKK